MAKAIPATKSNPSLIFFYRRSRAAVVLPEQLKEKVGHTMSFNGWLLENSDSRENGLVILTKKWLSSNASVDQEKWLPNAMGSAFCSLDVAPQLPIGSFCSGELIFKISEFPLLPTHRHTPIRLQVITAMLFSSLIAFRFVFLFFGSKRVSSKTFEKKERLIIYLHTLHLPLLKCDTLIIDWLNWRTFMTLIYILKWELCHENYDIASITQQQNVDPVCWLHSS